MTVSGGGSYKPFTVAVQGSCELCGASVARPIMQKRGYELVRCGGCSLLRVEPLPSAAEVERLYEAAGPGGLPLRYARFDLGRARQLARIVGSAPPAGRLLDVGCAGGTFLVEARALGWDTRGIEISGDKVARAREERRLNVEQGRAEDVEARFGEGAFDVITLWDVLEHLRHPLEALRRIAGRLKRGGRLYIATPNVDGWVARFHYRTLRPLWGIWPHPEPPRHLYQFAGATIRRLCEAAGLEPVQLIHDEIPLWYTSGFRGEPRLEHWLHGESGAARARAIYLLSAPVFLAARLARRGDSMIVCARRE